MRTKSRRERDFCAAFELIGEQLVAAHTVLERKPVRDNGAQIVLSVAHEREKPLHIMTHRAAAGAVGEVRLGAVPGPPAAWVDQISRQLNELQNSVQSVAGGQLRSDAPMLLPGALGLLSAQLSEAGVAPGLSQELLTALLMEPGQGLKHLKPLQEQAAKILATRAGEPAVARLAKGVRTVVALVGPAGAGKTTAAARLAAHYSERHGARTALIAADTDRVGGLEQLKAYAGILQVPVDAVYTADDMAEVIRKRRDVDLILVDTGGASPHDVEELDRLRDLLREAAPSEIHLVIGAPTGLPQMFDTIRAFTRIGADHLLLTKLDETSRLGAACTVASEAKLPLSFFTDGRNVPGNLLPADPDWLAQSLFERSPNGAAK